MTATSLMLVVQLALGSAIWGIAPVMAASPVAITNVDSPDPVASGSEILYTISVTNTGGAKLTGVTLRDQLNGVGGTGVPPQLQLTSTIGPTPVGSCSQTTTLVSCSAGILQGGQTWVVTIKGVVTAAAGAVLNNTATVTGTKSATTFTASATATTTVTGTGPGGDVPDLTISKNGPGTVYTGDPINYTLTVNNLGTANAANVKVVDTLAAGVTGISASGTSLFTCGVVDQTVTCTGGAVNAGANATITIAATAPTTTGTIENTSVVDPDGAIAESNEFNNTSNKVSTSVVAPPPPTPPTISIAKAGPDIITPGDTITYTVVVQNGTLGRADYLTMTDGTQGLDASSIHVVSATAPSGTTPICKVAAPQVTCTMTRLAVNDAMTVVIEGMVIAPAGSTILNTASINANIKNHGYTATATVQTVVKPGIDLTITKAASPEPVCARSWPGTDPAAWFPPAPLTPANTANVCRESATPSGRNGGLVYSFVVGNSGIKDATGVVVRDPLPAGVVYDSFFTDGGFTCALGSGNVVTCTGGAIPAESTRYLTLVTVAPPTVGAITDQVTVDPANAIYESDETNNVASVTTNVVTGVDLVVDKTVKVKGHDPVATSGTETWTIFVDDIGPQEVTGIHVRDTLPSGTRFRTASGDHGFTCSAVGQVVDCVGGHLLGTAAEFYPPFGAPGNDIATITIVAFAQSFDGIMHNEVRVDPDNTIAEANELNNLATLETAVGDLGETSGAFNQLVILKQPKSPAAGHAVAPNGTLVYEILIGNDGSDDAVDVAVRDFLPTGARFIEATGDHQFHCTEAGGIVDCVGGQIPAHVTTPSSSGHATITITVFAPGTPGTYTNQAIVDPDHQIPEGNEKDNTSSMATLVDIATGENAFNELSVTKNAVPDPVSTSSVVTFTVEVKNTGSDLAFNVVVRDDLPVGFTYLDATDDGSPMDPNAFYCSAAGTVVTCTSAGIPGTETVPGGGTRTIKIRALAAAMPGQYTNQVVVDPGNTIPEANETNNTYQTQFWVKVAQTEKYIDLAFDSTPIEVAFFVPSGGGSPDHQRAGQEIAYTLNVTNGGTNPAFGVVLRDQLPAGSTFVSALDMSGTAGAFSCTEAGGIVTCTGGTLDGSDDLIPGVPQSRAVRIVVRAPFANGSLVEQATLDPADAIAEADETNNSASVTNPVHSDINLIAKKSGNETASQGTTAEYTIEVKNEGTQDAQGVLIRDELPVGLIPLGVEVNDGFLMCTVYQNPYNVVECSGDMPAGATYTIKVHTFVTAESGTLYNKACIDPSDTILEWSQTLPIDGNGDNCGQTATQVGAPDLQVNVTADPATATAGGVLTYTVVVSNVGTLPAPGSVTLTDTLSGDVTFVDASATDGWDCSHSGTDVTCSGSSGLGVGGVVTITIHTTVNTGATADIQNTAGVPSVGGDPNSDNNSETITTPIGSTGYDFAIDSILDQPDPVNPGAALTYTVTATNNGTASTGSDEVHVRIILPTSSDVTPTGATGTNGFICDGPTSGEYDCHFTMPGNGSTVITVQLAVGPNAQPQQIWLTAWIDPNSDFTDIDLTNNVKTEFTTVESVVCNTQPCLDLVATEATGSPVGPVATGASVAYTFVVTNVGTIGTAGGPQPNAHVQIGLAGAYTATGTPTTATAGWACTDITGADPQFTVQWDCVGDLGAGEGVTFTVSGVVAGAAGGTITAGLWAVPLPTEYTDQNNGWIYANTAIQS